MDYSTFQQYAQDYTAIPISRRLMADMITPVALFKALQQNGRYPFLLESVEGGEQLGRYSFLGVDPFEVLRFQDATVTLQTGEQKPRELKEDYFSALDMLTTRYREPELNDLPRLRGGAVGFSSYDTVRQIEHLPNVPEDDLQLPEAIWAFYDQIYAFDHVKHQIILIKTVLLDERSASNLSGTYNQAQQQLDAMEQRVMNPGSYGQSEIELNTNQVTSNFSEDAFAQSVAQCKEYIREGDIFQVVLSQRLETPYSGDRFQLYRALRMVNPSPYLFYLDFEDFALVGSSPEVLVQTEENRVRVLPIAGTRRRGRTEREDLAMEEELRNDPKEIAEHVMLVDLGRNDVARVSKPGTVEVTRNQTIERYSHVMHIVSEVQGELQEEASSVHALQQCFPAGTVSGAPKIRAMEIIDELEPTKRGPYAGAVGYFDFSGNMDTCIAIRTMVVTDSNIYIQAGAGIVADSDPQLEYQETQNKANALLQALSVAIELT
ncbi:MAG: anthranilate synthase component I [Bacteroidota bacterium]